MDRVVHATVSAIPLEPMYVRAKPGMGHICCRWCELAKFMGWTGQVTHSMYVVLPCGRDVGPSVSKHRTVVEHERHKGRKGNPVHRAASGHVALEV
jgi:hypothetical protein